MEQVIATLTPGQIFLVCIGALLAAAELVNVVGAAFERIAKAKAKAEAPNKAQDDQLRELERRMDNVERMLGNDKHSLNEINSGLEASFQVQLALLDHALNGNNIEQMQRARDALYVHLSHPHK